MNKLPKTGRNIAVAIILTIFMPYGAWGVGHDECKKCHGDQFVKSLDIISQKRDIPIINPSTGKPLQRIEALCLDCHGDEKYKDQLKQLGMFREVDESAEAPAATAVLDELELKPANVGFRIIDLHQTHPVEIVPRNVKVPTEAMGFKGQEDQLTCMGCHNHHPSNPNYKYLRWPAGKDNNLNDFCAHCHTDKKKPAVSPDRPGKKRGLMD